MRFEKDNRAVASRVSWWLGILLVFAALSASFAGAQSSSRRVRTKVVPVEPELARRLNLIATVKVQVTVAPNGAVVEAKALGGHPLLIAPSLEAAKQFRYEPAGETSTMLIEFHFVP
jgi:Gram-negative bacterial TonB protein C-terminal